MLLPTCQLISARHYSTLLCAATESMRLGLLVLFFLGDGVTGAKILALFPFPFYSHTHTFIPVFKELAARGHHLTFLSPYPQVPAPDNWTNIPIGRKPSKDESGYIARYLSNAHKYEFFYIAWKSCTKLMEQAFEDRAFDSLLRDSEFDYDLIITEAFICHEPLVALGAKHNIPVVSVYPLPLTAYVSYFTGDSFLSSYIPDCRTSYSDQMSFSERVDNTLMAVIQIALCLFFYLPKQELLMEKYIYHDSKNHPPLVEILKNISIHLVDSHYTLAYARSYQSRTIQVGGLSIAGNSDLTKDLQDFMDNSQNGFIYLNFGSEVPVSSMSKDTVDSIMRAFREINMNFLMKWENESLSNMPKNIKIKSWFPQPSVLAHHKCRLFITHGGKHGISEAAYYGVPIIGIPFLSDQFYNVNFAVQIGFAYQLLKEDITSENLKKAIETVLNDNSYRENALRRSKVMRDQPDSALNTAVYWIEYTLRHKDLSHLRPASTGLPLYQLYLLDVFAFILICILTVLMILFYFLRATYRLIKNLKSPMEVPIKKYQ